MKMKLTYLSAAMLIVVSAAARPAAFSDDARVSLVTCAPGKEAYERFGHTALRVKDSRKGLDLVFNYGVFDFSFENFYWKFIKGETDYKLAVYDFDDFLPEYVERHSMVWEQVLLLRPDEKRRLLDALAQNYLPKNRVYRYNFTFDNCATRPRLKIEEALDGCVDYGRFAESVPDATFREWVNLYAGHEGWLAFGINIIFGLEADRTAGWKETMFLPEMLKNGLAAARVLRPGDEHPARLASEARPLLRGYTTPPGLGKSPLPPQAAMWGLALFCLVTVVLSSTARKTTRLPLRLLDTLLLSVGGLIGCVIFFLDYVSIHPMVGDNLNILWLHPLYLVFAVTQWFPSLRRMHLLLGIFFFLNYVAFGILMLVFHQFFDNAIALLFISLFLRVGESTSYVLRYDNSLPGKKLYELKTDNR